MHIEYGVHIESIKTRKRRLKMTTINAKNLGEALLAATFETTIAKVKTFQINLADFPLEAAIALMQYGVGRKFNDAVGGADKNAETKVSLAASMIEDWKQGKIGRQPTASVPNETKVRRTVVRELFNAKASDDQRKAFKELEADKQAERLDAIFDKQNDERKAAIMADVASRIEAAAAKAKQVKALGEAFEL